MVKQIAAPKRSSDGGDRDGNPRKKMAIIRPKMKIVVEAVEEKAIIYKAVTADDEQPVSVLQWVTTMLRSSDDRRLFIRLLSESTFPSFFFECIGVNSESCGTQQFLFSLVYSSELHRRVTNLPHDISTFHKFFAESNAKGKACAVFSNLSGDATLVSPLPSDATNNLSKDLASFVRFVQVEKVSQFISDFLQEYHCKLLESRGNIYLSTHGTGVNWLHVRIEPEMKYYVTRCFPRSNDFPLLSHSTTDITPADT